MPSREINPEYTRLPQSSEGNWDFRAIPPPRKQTPSPPKTPSIEIGSHSSQELLLGYLLKRICSGLCQTVSPFSEGSKGDHTSIETWQILEEVTRQAEAFSDLPSLEINDETLTNVFVRMIRPLKTTSLKHSNDALTQAIVTTLRPLVKAHVNKTNDQSEAIRKILAALIQEPSPSPATTRPRAHKFRLEQSGSLQSAIAPIETTAYYDRQEQSRGTSIIRCRLCRTLTVVDLRRGTTPEMCPACTKAYPLDQPRLSSFQQRLETPPLASRPLEPLETTTSGVRGTRLRSSLLIAGCLALGSLAVGATYRLSLTTETQPSLSLPESNTRIANEGSSPWETLRQFHQAQKIIDKLPYIRFGDKLIDALQSHDAQHQHKEEPIEKTSTIGYTQFFGKPFAVVKGTYRDGSEFIAALEQTANGYLLDWESFTGYNNPSWETLLLQKPETTVYARVIASPVTTFNNIHCPEEQYRCYQLVDLDNTATCLAYVSKYSQTANLLDQYFEMPPSREPSTASSTLSSISLDTNQSRQRRLYLGLHFEEDNHGEHYALIDRVVSPHWIAKENNASVQP